MLQARTYLPRTEGTLRLAFTRREDGSTALETLHQAGAARARFPRAAAGAPPEAVLLNTAGGLTGGDRIDIRVALGAGAGATLTTAAAEKIYRSLGDDTSICVELGLSPGATLHWLPQPTILFDGAQLDRHTRVDLAADSSFLSIETLIFGRTAMGEVTRRGTCRDAWRIRRNGKLIFADTFRLEGSIATRLERRAILDGARAAAMLIYAAPDAAARLEATRALLAEGCSIAGASTWNNLLVVRALARDGAPLQRDMARLIEWLSGRPLPRVWQC